MMTHLEMKAMEKFPIEKLSYDLKLELLEDMDPRDVVELAKVNQGFQLIVVREPWRIFGKHVDYVYISSHNSSYSIRIEKIQFQISMGGGELAIKLSGSSSHLMQLKSFSTLISKIRSSQKLTLSLSSEDQEQEADPLPVKLLANLDSVSKLSIRIMDAKVDIQKYLMILTLNRINGALLVMDYFKRNERMLGVLSNFVKTRLKHCKSIRIQDYSRNYPFWYEPLSMIWAEIILLNVPHGYNEMDFGGLVNRIVTEGISSLNPDATILLWVYSYSERAKNSISGLLSQTLGICQIAHEDRGEIEEILEKLPLDKLISERSSVVAWGVDLREQRKLYVDRLREGVYFTRSIDSNRKCIYVTDSFDSFFFAKYISIA